MYYPKMECYLATLIEIFIKTERLTKVITLFSHFKSKIKLPKYIKYYKNILFNAHSWTTNNKKYTLQLRQFNQNNDSKTSSNV